MTQDDSLVRREADAAAAEAAAIGGPAPAPADVQGAQADPALAPVAEAGGGVSEGFEQAEAALVENAEEPERPGHPRNHAFPPEREADRTEASYGEADHVRAAGLEEKGGDPAAG